STSSCSGVRSLALISCCIAAFMRSSPFMGFLLLRWISFFHLSDGVVCVAFRDLVCAGPRRDTPSVRPARRRASSSASRDGPDDPSIARMAPNVRPVEPPLPQPPGRRARWRGPHGIGLDGRTCFTQAPRPEPAPPNDPLAPRRRAGRRRDPMSQATAGSALLEKVRSLRPLIEAEADATDRELTLTKPVIEALTETGLFHLMVPRALGGAEADCRTILDVFEELAHMDGSIAWSDRKSTRLNSSHVKISYAVFRLKEKT